MKIIYKPKKKVKFSSLSIGDTFTYGETICMKHAPVRIGCTDNAANAIGLYDATLKYFSDTELVEKTNGAFVEE